MNALPVWDRPVTYPHLLTDKALKMAQGKHVINVSDEDWSSYADYVIRVDIVDSIVARINEYLTIHHNASAD